MEAKRPPPCRALILSRGPDTEPAVLHFAGHRLIDAKDEGILRACFHGTGEGLWHWEGDLVTTTFDTPYGRDHDIEAQGEFRPLTREEFQEWASRPFEEPPWCRARGEGRDPVGQRDRGAHGRHAPDPARHRSAGDLARDPGLRRGAGVKLRSGDRYRAKATGSVYEVKGTTPTHATIKLHEWNAEHRAAVIAEAERSGTRLLIALQHATLPFEVEHRWFSTAARKV